MFNGIITTAATAHGVSKITDWRRVIFEACAALRSVPDPHHVGAEQVRPTPCHPLTLTVPTTTIATVAIRFFRSTRLARSMTVSSLTDMTIATTSADVRR